MVTIVAPPAVSSTEPIDADSAQLWGEIAPPVDEDALAEALLDETAATPYLLNEELNFRIALWQGDVTSLKIDAIINCNNEDLNERSGVSGEIFATAGPQLEEACTRLGGCAPGEAKATRGFRLPAKHIIHTVPPAWSDSRDAEATLERCYTSSLAAATQLHCATVAFSCIKTKDSPREQAAHVALRTIRKLLEQPAHRGIQLLLFAMRPQDVYDSMVYENLLPLYFPRSAQEEHDAAKLLPLATGGAMPRTQAGAAGAVHAFATGSAAGGGHVGHDFSCDPSPALANLTQPPKLNADGSYDGAMGAMGANGGGGMGRGGGGASAKVSIAAATMSAAQEKMLRGSAYASFLQRAGLADLSDIEAMQLFYRGGVDARGRPIFLFWAGHLPSRPVDLERVLMHIMRTLDAHVHGGYIIVYVHTSLTPENEPSFAWLRKVYDLFDRRLKDNLHLLYIVHPSWWLRMAMNFMKTFVASGRMMDSKIIQLQHFADLFTRNYFTPGSLRMPDSPLVRKYLEMSDDVHLLDSIMGADEATREARAEALASAVSAGAVPGGAILAPGVPPAERAAVAIAAAEREAAGVVGADGRGDDGATSHQLAQAKASKEILLKQLIELSDQLAHSRAASDEVEQRLGAVQVAKDKEINRLSNALYDAQRDVDEAKRKLESVHTHQVTMEDQKRERIDALAEIADLEAQLAQTQIYNHHMAKELMALHKQVRSDKWEMLHEMSSLERQLEAARAAAHLGSASSGVGASASGSSGEGGATGGDGAMTVTPQSRVEEIAKLHAALTAEREEVAQALRALREQSSEFEYALKRAAEEHAALQGAEAARAVEAETRQQELQKVARELEEKIGAIKTAAHIGASASSESHSLRSRELSELEAIVIAAEEDVGRIEAKLSEPAGGSGASLPELREMRDLLTAQIRALDGADASERKLEQLAARKDASMQAVAQQLVPQMNSLQQQHEAQVRRFAAEAEAAAADGEALQRIAAEREAEASRHESDLGDLETKAASALAALEERFESEVEDVKLKQRATKLERQRLVSRLEGVEARMAGLELFPQTAGAGAAHGERSEAADQEPVREGRGGGGGSSFGATRGGGGVGGRAGARGGRLVSMRGARGGEAKEWIMERLAFFFEESADAQLRKVLRHWAQCSAFLAGMEAAGGSGSSGTGSGGSGGVGGAAWAQARAEKVALVRQLDEQAQQLAHASMALAVTPAGAMPGGGGGGGSASVELAPAEASAARQMMVLRNDLAFANNRLAELEDEREAMLRQLQNARDAAERLAIEARGAAEGGAAAQYALAEGRVPQGEQDDITYRLAGAANKLSVELSRAPPPRPPPAPRSSVAAESSAGSEDFGALVESLEQQRVEIEAALVVEGDSFAAASEHVSAAEQRLESLQRSGGGAGGGEPSPDERAALVSAQRALDDAIGLRDEANLKVDELSGKLQQLYPRLHEARERHQALRRRAEAALSGGIVTFERRAREVGSLAEARAHIEVLAERLKEAERVAAQSRAASASASAAETAGAGSGGARPSFATGAPPRDEVKSSSSSSSPLFTSLDAHAESEEMRATLELERAEKRRLQQLVDDMKRGDMSAIFRQAQEEAEREVLKRMLSTSVDLSM